MEFRFLDPTFAVAAQPQPEDLPALARAGFLAVIANRPDGEEEGQPETAAMRAAAEAAGLAFHHLPTRPGHYSAPTIAAFRAVRQGTPGPILAYCRSGARALALEVLANPHKLGRAEQLRRLSEAGFDPAPLAASLGA